jgi:hypothetical protein
LQQHAQYMERLYVDMTQVKQELAELRARLHCPL